VIGIGIGAVLLAVAAGGGADEAPLRFSVETAHRNSEAGLSEGLPDRFPVASYLRDRPVPPKEAQTLANLENGETAVFSVGSGSIGFLGHPGVKSGMIEDLIIEFDETPPETAQALETLRRQQAAIAESLSSIMRFIVNRTGWMDIDGDAASDFQRKSF
jgi:GMP synthase-like glutamine amidotransferase